MQTLLNYFKNKTVLVTGNTGFKGSWLTALLLRSGSRVIGYALPPETNPALYHVLRHSQDVSQHFADIRDLNLLQRVLKREQPDIVIHLAAQALVRQGYADPITTFETNIMGTAYLLQAARAVPNIRSVVVATTDKVYADHGNSQPYREEDRLGGTDPYSASKACAELITHCYRNKSTGNGCPIATARAGNVLGGGDWSADRLVPDLIRAHYHDRAPINLRYPDAIRPWQHVLDPLIGYLLLAKRLAEGHIDDVGAWNFAPDDASAVTVREVVKRSQIILGSERPHTLSTQTIPFETSVLRLDAARSRRELGWQSRLGLADTLDWTFRWYRDHYAGEDARILVERQIGDYTEITPS